MGLGFDLTFGLVDDLDIECLATGAEASEAQIAPQKRSENGTARMLRDK